MGQIRKAIQRTSGTPSNAASRFGSPFVAPVATSHAARALIRENGMLALAIRNSHLRAAARITAAGEALGEGQDAVDAAHTALANAPNIDQHLKSAEDRAFGAPVAVLDMAPPPAEQDRGVTRDDRELALHMLAFIGRVAFTGDDPGPETSAIDVTPKEDDA